MVLAAVPQSAKYSEPDKHAGLVRDCVVTTGYSGDGNKKKKGEKK